MTGHLPLPLGARAAGQDGPFSGWTLWNLGELQLLPSQQDSGRQKTCAIPTSVLVLNQPSSLSAYKPEDVSKLGASPRSNKFAKLEHKIMALLNWFKLSIQSLWNKNEYGKCVEGPERPGFVGKGTRICVRTWRGN